ncbi:MAG: hypothetical protein ACJAVV_000663 [Alphaproteobacteria bacterium]|jgi:hypothetical protein
MAMSKNTKFWISRISVMIAVMACALAFLTYVPDPGASLEASADSGGEKQAGIAASVTRFYSEFKQSSNDPILERFGKDTIILEEHNEIPLGKVIDQVSPKSYRPIDNWEGNYKERAFSSQSTLMQEASAHIASEGFNLVWDLNQDFTVRHRYQSTATLVGMLEEIAAAIDSNFNQPIVVYFCTDKRALVITVRESEYLRNNCQKSNGSFQYY